MVRSAKLSNLKKRSEKQLNRRYSILKDEHNNVRSRIRQGLISKKDGDRKTKKIGEEVRKTTKAIRYRRSK